MNWEAAGAIGEIAGALAVVVTLAYLAVQVRHNTALAQANAFEQSTETSNAAFQPLLDSDMAELFLKGCSGYLALDPPDRLRFFVLLAGLFQRFEVVLEKRRLGFVDDLLVAPYEAYFRDLRSEPGVREYLDQHMSYHTAILKEWIDQQESEKS